MWQRIYRLLNSRVNFLLGPDAVDRPQNSLPPVVVEQRGGHLLIVTESLADGFDLIVCAATYGQPLVNGFIRDLER
jgi:hypothetical protein